MNALELWAAGIAVYQSGQRHAAPLPAWLVGELVAASRAGEPFPLGRLGRVICAARNKANGAQPLNIELTPREARIASGIAAATVIERITGKNKKTDIAA
ncbi:hypothetical protein [Aeromonas sobria]|uniref:hypothetical protein n=1 Tax=Aeromonas sobria TaxID=646 RepID=UPI0011DF7A84|nr:hypothetical protein [Aeromonas sobria]